MLNSMPPAWSRRVRALPEFADTRQWNCLRHGRHSEVWRVTLASGATLIAKRGVGAEVREAQVYHDLLDPLALPHPTVFAALPDGDAQILLMEDLGSETVNSRPTVDRFAEAARTLADLRRHAAARLHQNGWPATVLATYALPADTYRVSVQRVMDRAGLDPPQRGVLTRVRETLPRHVERLYDTGRMTITHNDFNAKNLIVTAHGVRAIDWSHAELTPHLGDLYCLLRDAARHGVAEPDVMGPYLARDPVTDSAWHISMGGLCWLIRGLHWTWDIGSRMPDVAPVTAAMVGAMAECLDRMEYA